jgi:hypothetical protein
MKKWLMIAISLIAAVIINFNSSSLIILLIFSLILGAIIFLILTLADKLLNHIKKKEYPRALAKLGFILLIMFGCYIIYAMFTGACFAVATLPYFRANIFTGECDYGGGGHDSCSTSSPWYYKKGCGNLTKEQKIEIIKTSSSLDELKITCAELCSIDDLPQNCSYSFVPYGFPDQEILCSDIS